MTSKFSSRYTIPEDEGYEPDSNDEVLKNCLEGGHTNDDFYTSSMPFK